MENAQKNPGLRELAASNRPILNCWLSVPSPLVAEVLARQGFDSVCLDMQHGMLDFSDCLGMLQSVGHTGATALVRVPGSDPAIMMKVLDAGAQGIIVPLVDSAAEAAAAVAACRYPPAGGRSFGPTRAALLSGPDYHLRANDEILVFAMIETLPGLENLEEIAATPGLDGIYIGPSDLSYALGLPPLLDNDHPQHLAVVARIIETCRRHSLIVGIHTAQPEFAQRAFEMGAHMATVATDMQCLREEARRRLACFSRS